ncbi:hypothetical protein [Paraburkholderia youngii]|uniref:Uncharacterized protein n=1 Tax=Paraburkholderia youngii TaxID=2782701 RepID=A0A7W8P0U8_9BURK|nr:hypothetical protein [Paraburkholderia youngii]MBB5400559.1 hypothetical protein [Paraburkholderia youngii]
MPTVNAYIPQVSALIFETEEGVRKASACIEFGGWNADKATLTPIKVGALLAMPGAPTLTWVMDSLAAAVEAGRVDPETCLTQLFASPSDMRDMRAVLRDEGRELWLSDRHRSALLKLGASSIDLVSYADVAAFFDPA